MSTLAEIEAAVEKLPRPQQAALLDFVARRLQAAAAADTELRRPRHELLAKWRAWGSTLVQCAGGTQAYLHALRGRDENGG